MPPHNALALQIPLNDEPEIKIIPDDPDAFDADDCSIYAVADEPEVIDVIEQEWCFVREDRQHLYLSGATRCCRVWGGASVNTQRMWAAMSANIYRIECIVCPWCGKQSGQRVDHLYDRAPRSWGPWSCGECKLPFRGTVTAPGEVTVEKDEKGSVATRSMALLKFDGKEGPVYFVMDHARYRRAGEVETDEEHQSHQRYFFEEHSCPTNWLRECVAVIDDGECDPHGFLEFVRAVDVPQDFDEHDDQQWPILFPEAFTGEVIEGTATEVKHHRAITKRDDEPQS